MHNNFYLYRRQIEEIGSYLQGKTISDIFVLNKTDIVLELINNEESSLFLVFITDVQTPAVLLEKRIDHKTPRTYVFPLLKRQTIRKISILPFDKHIILETDTFSVETVLYGRRFNIFIQDNAGKIVDSLYKSDGIPQQRGMLRSPAGKSEPVDLSTFSGSKLHNLPITDDLDAIGKFIQSYFAAINRTLLNEILFRIAQNVTLIPGSIPTRLGKLAPNSSNPIEFVKNVLSEIAREMQTKPVYLYFETDAVSKLSLIRLHYWEKQTGAHFKEYETVNHAWVAFVYKRRFRQQFDKLYQKCRQALDKRAVHLQKALQKIEELSNLEKRKREAEMKGNLLLTYKNQIPPGSSRVELDNIFSKDQEKITVKLNPAKSVSENAQRYFNKFKNIRQMSTVQTIKKETYRAELDEIRQLQQKLKVCDRMPKLQALYKECLNRNLIQASRPRQKSENSTIYSFNRIRIDKDWEVLIGKSGVHNDRLTFEVARKWDIWMHAQGVAGAHVILRLPNRNVKPPRRIIEQAAAIAAANSKARHSGTVPVVYTEVRYVQRLRKAAPGTVTLRNEQVIFVTPLKLSG